MTQQGNKRFLKLKLQSQGYFEGIRDYMKEIYYQRSKLFNLSSSWFWATSPGPYHEDQPFPF